LVTLYRQAFKEDFVDKMIFILQLLIFAVFETRCNPIYDIIEDGTVLENSVNNQFAQDFGGQSKFAEPDSIETCNDEF